MSYSVSGPDDITPREWEAAPTERLIEATIILECNDLSAVGAGGKRKPAPMGFRGTNFGDEFGAREEPQ